MYKKLICPDNIIQIINNELWKMTKTKIARHLLILVIVSVSESKHNFNAKKKLFRPMVKQTWAAALLWLEAGSGPNHFVWLKIKEISSCRPWKWGYKTTKQKHYNKKQKNTEGREFSFTADPDAWYWLLRSLYLWYKGLFFSTWLWITGGNKEASVEKYFWYWPVFFLDLQSVTLV